MAEVTIEFFADMRDPSDPNGRSYRQVNAAKQHAIPLGSLVEMESGARLFVVMHTRDCDQSPLYSLSVDPPDDDGAPVDQFGWHHGYGEDGLRIVEAGQ